MARSTYVYVVLRGGEPVAGFTVKHELLTWLEHHHGNHVVYRLGDGGAGRPPQRMGELA
jgi:hypothetical protein